MSGNSEGKKGVGMRDISKAVPLGFHRWETLGCQGDWHNQGQPKVWDWYVEKGVLGEEEVANTSAVCLSRRQR